MRIITLSILFFTSFYYFWPKEESVAPRAQKIDSIKLKMSATDRAERILTVEPKKIIPQEAPALVASSDAETEQDRAPAVEESQAETDELDRVEEIAWSDNEAAWNNELKEVLYRLDPQESENIHKSYVSERESFLSEVENLVNEKQQKTSPEAVQEIEQLIAGIEEKHEEKVKEIFGANYEAVKEQYDTYMENNPASSEE